MIALIEDEKEKAEALLNTLLSFGHKRDKIQLFDNVLEAIEAVENTRFRKVILDVSLPTYSSKEMAGSAGRAQQQSGGLEIIRAFKEQGISQDIVIVTQHPDILFHNESVKLKDVPQLVKREYGQNVLAAILYRENQRERWQAELKTALGDNV